MMLIRQKLMYYQVYTIIVLIFCIIPQNKGLTLKCEIRIYLIHDIDQKIEAMNFCIYKSSDHYQLAFSNPTDICKPVGYDILHAPRIQSAETPQISVIKQKLDLSDLSKFSIKTLSQKSIVRTLSHYRSQKLTPDIVINQYLKSSQLQRKNQYLSGNVLQFLINTQKLQATILDLSARFFPLNSQISSDQKSLIQISQLLYNPYLQSIYHIENHALSKYFVLFQNSNKQRIDFVCDALNRKLLGYEIQAIRILHQKKKEQNYQFACSQYQCPSNNAALKQIVQKIQIINNQQKKKDPFYDGISFYFADHSQIMNSECNLSLLKRQHVHLPVLQYFILMITGLLAPSQSAILKVQGSFQHKTIQYLYMLYLIFDGKVTITKPLGSNMFTPDTYVICESYNKQIGSIIHQYLIDNFGVLYGQKGKGTTQLQHFIAKQNSEPQVMIKNEKSIVDRLKDVKKGQQYLYIKQQKLLIDTKKLIKDDFQSISQFNDSLIYKGLQSNIKQFKKNQKILFYPNKTQIVQKIKDKHCRNLQPIIQHILQQKIEVQQKIAEQKKPERIKKQADFSMLSMIKHTRPAMNRQDKSRQKHKKKKDKHEQRNVESGEKKNALQSFLEKVHNKNEEQKRNKSKNKNKKK